MFIFLNGLIAACGVLAAAGAILLLAFLYRIIVKNSVNASKKNSFDNHLLMKTLLNMIEQGQIARLYINHNMVCFNFAFTDHATTTTTKNTYTGAIVNSVTTHKYTCQLTPQNIFDFYQMGYQPIGSDLLHRYIYELLDRAEAMPNVSSVTSYENLTFTPANLFISNGQYGKQPYPSEKMYIFTYRTLGAKVSAPRGVKKIG